MQPWFRSVMVCKRVGLLPPSQNLNEIPFASFRVPCTGTVYSFAIRLIWCHAGSGLYRIPMHLYSFTLGIWPWNSQLLPTWNARSLCYAPAKSLNRHTVRCCGRKHRRSCNRICTANGRAWCSSFGAERWKEQGESSFRMWGITRDTDLPSKESWRHSVGSNFWLTRTSINVYLQVTPKHDEAVEPVGSWSILGQSCGKVLAILLQGR